MGQTCSNTEHKDKQEIETSNNKISNQQNLKPNNKFKANFQQIQLFKDKEENEFPTQSSIQDQDDLKASLYQLRTSNQHMNQNMGGGIITTNKYSIVSLLDKRKVISKNTFSTTDQQSNNYMTQVEIQQSLKTPIQKSQKISNPNTQIFNRQFQDLSVERCSILINRSPKHKTNTGILQKLINSKEEIPVFRRVNSCTEFTYWIENIKPYKVFEQYFIQRKKYTFDQLRSKGIFTRNHFNLFPAPVLKQIESSDLLKKRMRAISIDVLSNRGWI